MRSVFDDINWMCNARTKGVEYANLVERVKECEERTPSQASITITLGYPRRQKHRGLHRGGIRR